MARLTDRLSALEALRDPADVEDLDALIEIITLFAVVLEAKNKSSRDAQETFLRNHSFSEVAVKRYAEMSYNKTRDEVAAFIPEATNNAEVVKDAMQKMRAAILVG